MALQQAEGAAVPPRPPGVLTRALSRASFKTTPAGTDDIQPRDPAASMARSLTRSLSRLNLFESGSFKKEADAKTAAPTKKSGSSKVGSRPAIGNSSGSRASVGQPATPKGEKGSRPTTPKRPSTPKGAAGGAAKKSSRPAAPGASREKSTRAASKKDRKCGDEDESAMLLSSAELFTRADEKQEQALAILPNAQAAAQAAAKHSGKQGQAEKERVTSGASDSFVSMFAVASTKSLMHKLGVVSARAHMTA